MYRTDILPRLNDGLLYHFTKAESLFKILENMTLKLSPFNDDLNDLNEIDLNCYYTDSILNLSHKRYVKEHCRLTCFCQNYKVSDSPFVEGDYNHPRMWAQYADNNKGVCIIIDEDKFLEINEEILQDKFYTFENIEYKPYLYDKTVNSSLYENSFNFVSKYYKHIFFRKHTDWREECERRFWGIDIPEFLSIDGCIEYICLGRKFSKENYKELIQVLDRSIASLKQKLTPHDFALQVNSDGRVSIIQNAHNIVEHTKKEHTTYYNYLLSENYDLI